MLQGSWGFVELQPFLFQPLFHKYMDNLIASSYLSMTKRHKMFEPVLYQNKHQVYLQKPFFLKWETTTGLVVFFFLSFFSIQDMTDRKESCASRQTPMTSLSCLVYALEEWTVVEFLKKYLFHVIIGSLAISAILVFFIVPLTIVFFIYLTNILLLIYQRNNEVKADPLSDVWNSVRKTIASFWDIYARIWHGKCNMTCPRLWIAVSGTSTEVLIFFFQIDSNKLHLLDFSWLLWTSCSIKLSPRLLRTLPTPVPFKWCMAGAIAGM